MSEKTKIDYLKFIFHKTNIELTRYNISSSDKELINKLFGRISYSDNLPKDLYIFSHIKEFKNIGKYFLFILKKIEDKVINYDNLSQNLSADVEFIENEILNYLSNPKLKDTIELKYNDDPGEVNVQDLSETTEAIDEDLKSEKYEEEAEAEEETDISDFKENYLDKKNYLELIQSEEGDDGNVYELPKIDGEEISEETNMAFELPKTETEEPGEKIVLEGEKISEEVVKDESSDSFVIKGKLKEEETEIKEDVPAEQSLFDKEENQILKVTNEKEEIKKDEENQESEGEKIQLSNEIQEEINSYEEEQKSQTEEENIFEEVEVIEEPPTNVLFLEYENQVKEKNEYLNNEFDRMINVVNEVPSAEEERNRIIKNILDTSVRLERISRDMSLEIISNIYQTVTLSFEKISEGKYDISQSTLNLFKQGLSLVASLIRGDDYFGYKDILKSIENIRNSLIEEKEKREQYLKHRQEKIELERELTQKYPDDSQRIKIKSIKKLIQDTEIKFNFLDKISGEYQIYEALRSLSGNLNNFKEIVKLSKELEMKKLVQLSEASYIFIKFLQNYRINPVTIEIKEIFGYIIYNLKSLVMGKEIREVDLFISYLNDPVKIFSKMEKKKN